MLRASFYGTQIGRQLPEISDVQPREKLTLNLIPAAESSSPLRGCSARLAGKEYSYASENSSNTILDTLLVYLNFIFRTLGPELKKFSSQKL